jgi:hypothetical protein
MITVSSIIRQTGRRDRAKARIAVRGSPFAVRGSAFAGRRFMVSEGEAG